MFAADFFTGMITMGFVVCSLFFLRFWRRTRDWLFLVFAVAFVLLAINACLGTLLDIPRAERSWIFLFRLAAFSMIIAAILRKNIGR